MITFLISQQKHNYVVTPHLNRLDETVLMMGHNIHFKGILWKIISCTPSYLEHNVNQPCVIWQLRSLLKLSP